jgi:hypothetical protein
MIANGVKRSSSELYRLGFFFYVFDVLDLSIQSDELYMNWYRQQVSILCPRGYEPRALPLRHAGF